VDPRVYVVIACLPSFLPFAPVPYQADARGRVDVRSAYGA